MIHRAPTTIPLLLALTACAGNGPPFQGANASTPSAVTPTATLAPPAAEAAPLAHPSPDPMAGAPWAENVEEPLSEGVVTVSVVGDKVLVGGAAADDARPIREAGRPLRLVGLFDALKAARERWVLDHPARPFPGLVAFHLDENETAAVVKSVFQTAAFAAYPNASFEVRAIPEGKRGWIPADAQVPDPRPGHARPALDDEDGLKVQVQAHQVKLVWKQGSAVLTTQTIDHPAVVSPRGGFELVRVPAVGSAVASQWKEHSAHQVPEDAALDRVVLHVDNDVPFKLLVATLDALHGVKRERMVEGAKRRLSALNITLVVN